VRQVSALIGDTPVKPGCLAVGFAPHPASLATATDHPLRFGQVCFGAPQETRRSDRLATTQSGQTQ
jgi:hypothetical protein